MAIDIYSDQFVDNLPDSLTWDNQVQTVGMVSDQQAAGLQPFLPQLLILPNINNLPEAILDLLAFQYSVLFYSSTFYTVDPLQRIALKRQLLSNNFNYHAHLGTPAVMQQIVSSIYGPAAIQEWPDYGGTANHFRILLPTAADPSLLTEMSQVVNVVKRASQYFEGFFSAGVAQIGFTVSVVVFTQTTLTLPVIQSPLGDFISVGASVKIFISVGASVTVVSNVIRASAVAKLKAAASLVATSRQLRFGAMVCTIQVRSTVTTSALILRGASVNIVTRSS
jgi:P2-related tail formation protein